jgi:hypothetical protein
LNEIDRNNEIEMIPRLSWRDQFTAFRATLLLFAIAVIISFPALTGSGRDLDYFANLARFLAGFFRRTSPLRRRYFPHSARRSRSL